MVPEPLGSSGWHEGRRRCRFGCRLPPAQRSYRVGAVWAAMPGVKSWPMIAVCCALRRLCRPTPPPPSPRRTASTNEVLDDGDHHHPWRDRPVPGADHSARRCIHPLDSSLPLPPHTRNKAPPPRFCNSQHQPGTNRTRRSSTGQAEQENNTETCALAIRCCPIWTFGRVSSPRFRRPPSSSALLFGAPREPRPVARSCSSVTLFPPHWQTRRPRAPPFPTPTLNGTTGIEPPPPGPWLPARGECHTTTLSTFRAVREPDHLDNGGRRQSPSLSPFCPLVAKGNL